MPKQRNLKKAAFFARESLLNLADGLIIFISHIEMNAIGGDPQRTLYRAVIPVPSVVPSVPADPARSKHYLPVPFSCGIALKD